MLVFPYMFANGHGLCMDGMATISKELNRSCSNQNYTPGTIDWWVPKLKQQTRSLQDSGKVTQEDKSISIWNGGILTYSSDVSINLQLLLTFLNVQTAFNILILPLDCKLNCWTGCWDEIWVPSMLMPCRNKKKTKNTN